MAMYNSRRAEKNLAHILLKNKNETKILNTCTFVSCYWYNIYKNSKAVALIFIINIVRNFDIK